MYRNAYSNTTKYTGAELFLTVEEDSYKPIRMELLGGNAFGIKSFRTYTDILVPTLRHYGYSLTLKSCGYVRLIATQNHVCFLIFPELTTPVAAGSRQTLTAQTHQRVDIVLDGSSLVGIDGWLSFETEPSEYQLAKSQ